MRAFHFPNTEFGSYNFRRSVRVRRSVKADIAALAESDPQQTWGARDSSKGSYGTSTRASFWLDVGRPDHLAPLLGFVGDELAEIGG
jgi:hypothetical protein